MKNICEQVLNLNVWNVSSLVFVDYMTVDSGLEFRALLRQKNIPCREIRIIPSNNHGNKLLSLTLKWHTMVSICIMIFFDNKWLCIKYTKDGTTEKHVYSNAIIMSYVFAALRLELSFPVDFDESNQHPLLFILYVHALFSISPFLHTYTNTYTHPLCVQEKELERYQNQH